MLTPLSLFLYLIIWDINLVGLLLSFFRQCTCFPIFLSLQGDYNPMAWCENWPTRSDGFVSAELTLYNLDSVLVTVVHIMRLPF
jgi:hypothetical protein